ncbi:uncharacterized protein LOC105280040 [Ooceraea biroi]|uniref:uncharacterized protein LOC105280040 n=1 Tax=Ooceraea biroi TaxID=2015173 RepID=UPI0005B7A53A|nr:uncharacterized protein LOC105280040 [Ooceraea biroi]
MERPVGNEREDVENSESAVITSRMKQLVELRKSVEKSDKEACYWRNKVSQLLESNGNIEENYGKLIQEVSDIDTEISANAKIQAEKKQELRDFQSARATTSHKQWDDCLSEAGNYANHFSQWITEYSRSVLLKDIGNHREECRKVGDELMHLQRELNDMRREGDSDYIRANVDIDDLVNLDGVMSDVKSGNNNLMHAIRLKEDTLHKVQAKIERGKLAVNKYKTGEKNKIL